MKYDRSQYPPAIGTMECVVTTEDGHGLQEFPIIETFELRGETFGVILDLDWFDDDSWDDDVPGDVIAYHVGTGVRAGGWVHIGGVIAHVNRKWSESKQQDLYMIAESKGCPKVRGTVVPIDSASSGFVEVEGK